MKNRIRSLSLLILAFTFTFATVAVSRADGTATGTTDSSAPKPAGPTTGEPDTGAGSAQPPKPGTIVATTNVIVPGTTTLPPITDPVLLAILAALRLVCP